MAKGKYKQKKSQSAAQKYRNSLGENYIGISETYKSNDSLLTGSDNFNYDYGSRRDKQEEIATKPFSLVIKDWLRENLVSIIITAFLIPFIIWVAASIIDIQKGRAVSEYRIDELEKYVENLVDDIPNKENIELELDILKENVSSIDEEELENRIESLENKVYNK